MFECSNCKRETNKIIYPHGAKKTYCPACYDCQDVRPTYLHTKFPDAEAKGLTVAKAEVIANRVRSKDDPRVVIDRRTGRETQR